MKNFFKRNWQHILTVGMSVGLSLVAVYWYIGPVLAESTVVPRGSGVTRFNTPVQLLSGVTVENGLTVSSGSISLSALTGPLDMGAQVISNIGNSGTDFGSDGGLTTANKITVSTGGIASTGNITVTGSISSSQSIAAANGLTVTAGTISLPTGSIGIAAVADITQTVELPLPVFQDCTTPLALVFADGVDTKPDFDVINGTTAIVYDATAATVDTNLICTTFVVPTDYVSGAGFRVTVTQGAATVTNIESISCTVGLNGAAQGAAGATNLANQTAIQSVFSTPAGTFAAGNTVGLNCKQGNGSADDAVNILGIEFQYLATS